MFIFKTHGQDKPEAIKQQAQFKKLCQLCSPNFTKEDVLATEIDWPVVWGLALRHRVVPVMADRIKQLDIVVPGDIATMMADNVQQNLFKGMKQAAELVRLTQLFEENNIPFVVFKGIALLKLMGLELHQRHHGDIDILLADVGDVWKADEYLRQSGYERTNPPESLKLNPKQQEILLESKKDLVYWHPQKKMQLELHHRLCNNKTTFPVDINKIWKKRETVKFSNTTIPVMCQSDYLFYSLVHGSISRWFRLKWICDISLISNNGKDYESSPLLATAESLGIERMVMQGLTLSHRLFALPVSQVMEDYPSNDSVVEALISHAQNSMIIDEPEEVSNTSFITKLKALTSHMITYELKLRDDPIYKAQQLKSYLTAYPDWEALQLPSTLFFLYYPLRPLLWLKRQL